MTEVEASRSPPFADWAARILRGDREAERALVEHTYAGVLRMLTQRLHQAAVAQDLTQDTFAIVLQRLRAEALDDPQALSAFIVATARNLAIAHHRQQWRRQTDADTEAVIAAIDPAPGVAAVLDRAQLATAVRTLLRELPNERDRELLQRYYLLEQSKSRICEELELSDLHFNRVIHRARERFRALLMRQAPRLGLVEAGPLLWFGFFLLGSAIVGSLVTVTGNEIVANQRVRASVVSPS
jgi:RNA polymerase sigma-70 factor, ECF subfamily